MPSYQVRVRLPVSLGVNNQYLFTHVGGKSAIPLQGPGLAVKHDVGRLEGGHGRQVIGKGFRRAFVPNKFPFLFRYVVILLPDVVGPVIAQRVAGPVGCLRNVTLHTCPTLMSGLYLVGGVPRQPYLPV